MKWKYNLSTKSKISISLISGLYLVIGRTVCNWKEEKNSAEKKLDKNCFKNASKWAYFDGKIGR